MQIILCDCMRQTCKDLCQGNLSFISCPNFLLRLPVYLPLNHVISFTACIEKKYLKFKGVYISGHNIMTLENTDPYSCMAKCKDNSCARIEYQLPVCTEPLIFTNSPNPLKSKSYIKRK